MSGLSAVEISAIVSAVVTTSYNTVVGFGSRLVASIRQRVPDDHTALHAGSLRLGVENQVDLLAVQVSAAPSRRLRHRGLDIDAAITAVHTFFGDALPAEPERSGPDIGVSFAVMQANDAMSVDRRLWLHPSGRIDLYWCIPMSPATDPQPLDVLDLLSPLVTLARFLRSGSYDEIWRRRRLRWRRRFDWCFVAAMYVYNEQRTPRNWELSFPGFAPRRATDRHAFCPSAGYAADELRGWPMIRPTRRLIEVAVRSLLFHNGYHDVDDAVADVAQRF